MIDRQTIARIMDAADIVDVVSDFVTLKKAGANYKGLCPFHDDRTPSFSVSPARNYCHCFSCGKGGNPVSFIMEHEQMTYPEALRWLAKKYNIEIKERELTAEEHAQQTARESMFIVNEWVAQYYHSILSDDVDGRAVGMQYFRSRGFRDDIIEKFRLGFSLTDRHAMPRQATQKGYKAEFLEKTGLCYKNDRGELIDRFAGRAIFPWIGLSGKVVAFGGRKLDAATKGVQQKYVNSPESEIYHKDHELYGIYQAKKAIAKEDRVFMVEGYTDVISMHQCGIENVVANSGTALSVHQIHMLHRLTKNIVLLYDGDAAGIKAALRGTDMLLAEGMNVKILFIPDGDDPDSYARKHTAEEFRSFVDANITDFIQFKTDIKLKGVTDPQQRSEAISSIVKSISVIPDPILRATYLQQCAAQLRMPEKTLLTQMNRFISDAIKERDRRQHNAQPQGGGQGTADGQGYAQGSAANNPDQTPITQHPTPITQHPSPITQHPSSHDNDIERMLLQIIVRHGEMILFDNVETEDGQTVSLTVAEYISYNLAEDDLKFADPLANTILAETVEQSHREDFNAAPYFSQHPEYAISRLASDLLAEKYSLSKSLEYKVTQESLLQQVERLLLGWRRNIVDARLKDILQQIAACGDDSDKAVKLMEEYKDLKTISRNLSKKLGKKI